MTENSQEDLLEQEWSDGEAAESYSADLQVEYLDDDEYGEEEEYDGDEYDDEYEEYEEEEISNLDLLSSQAADEGEKFERLAKQMDVPLEYLWIGYTASGTRAGYEFPEHTSFEEFHDSILEDPLMSLIGRVIMAANGESIIVLGREEYLSQDLADKVWAWSEEHGGKAKPPLKKQGCYVATAVYGSYDCPEVWTLRRFRDFTLRKSMAGRSFIKVYYAISPTLVKWFGNAPAFNALTKGPLDALTRALQKKGFSDTPYQD